MAKKVAEKIDGLFVPMPENFHRALRKEGLYSTTRNLFVELYHDWSISNFKLKHSSSDNKECPLGFKSMLALANEYGLDRITANKVLKDLKGCKLISVAKKGHKLYIGINKKRLESMLESYKK